MTSRQTPTHPTRRRALFQLLGVAAASGPLSALHAQAPWRPAQTIRIVVPFAAGGGGDLITRTYTQNLQDLLGQPVVVDNRTGASGAIASEHVYRAPPDGYTLLMASVDSQAVNPHVNKVRFDTTKFVPVAGLGATMSVLVGRPNLPAKTLAEVIALGKTKPLSYSTPGVGTSQHVVTEMFERVVKVSPMLHVPYQGTAPALQAVVSGEVDVAFLPIALVRQYEGKLQMFAVSSEKRQETLPAVPSFIEQNVQIKFDLWCGLVAPPGTPSHIVEVLAKAVSDSAADAGIRRKLAAINTVPLAPSSREFTQYYLDEYKRWGEVVKAANIRAS